MHTRGTAQFRCGSPSSVEIAVISGDARCGELLGLLGASSAGPVRPQAHLPQWGAMGWGTCGP
jgi:hypothetical protein